MRRVALLSVLLCVGLPGVAAAAPEPGCLASSEERWLQESIARDFAPERGVSFEEMLRRLDLQDRFQSVSGEVSAALGEHYAGSWSDIVDHGGRYKLGYTAGADLTGAQRILAECGLTEFVDFVPLRWSWSELTFAQEGLNARLVSSLGLPQRWTSMLTVVDAAVHDGERVITIMGRQLPLASVDVAGELPLPGLVIVVQVAARGLPAKLSAAIDEAIAATAVTVVRVDVDMERFESWWGAPTRRRDPLERLATEARARLGRAYACAVQPDTGFPDLWLLVTRSGALRAARRVAANQEGKVEVRLTSARYRRATIRRIMRRARLAGLAATREDPYQTMRCPRVVLRPTSPAARRRAARLLRRFGPDRIVVVRRR